MPFADDPMSFGKFRRLIIDFIPKSKNEAALKAYLPDSSHQHTWWHGGIRARDTGRNLFRIHGTGKKNSNDKSPYYPFMRTNGCIAQRENTYGEVIYQDQRELLDILMTHLDLEPVFENETKIKGLLYMLELDDKKAPVTETDLTEWGIQ